MNIVTWIFLIFGGGIGFLATVYLTFSLPVVLIWKIYRSIRYRISLFD